MNQDKDEKEKDEVCSTCGYLMESCKCDYDEDYRTGGAS